MDNSFYNVSRKLLELNGICVDSKDFKKRLYTQEAYPSLKALTDVLSDLEIDYKALRIDWMQLQEYGVPVLLHYQGDVPRFVVAIRVTNHEITYLKNDLKEVTETKEVFSGHWNGAALYVLEKENQSFRCRLSEMFAKWNICILLVLTAVLLFPVFYTVRADSWYYCLFLLKSFGLFISVLLVRHDFGKRSAAERHLCSLTKQVSCDAVLNSAASKLFGIIKMSDIGIVYFSGGIIYMTGALLLPERIYLMDILTWFSFCTFPYMLFSLSYQKFKVRKWCPLCLGVLAVLSLEIGLGVTRFIRAGVSFVPVVYWLATGCFFGWVALFWGYLSRNMKAAVKTEENEIRFMALKRNRSVFDTMLQRQPALDMAFSDDDIILGDPDVPQIITLAINPFCTPCLDLYGKLVNLQQKHPGVFRLNIRFMSMDEERLNKQVGLILISIYVEGRDRFTGAFDDWREGKDYSSFATCYGRSGFPDTAKRILNTHFEWRKRLNIRNTPMIFVNNKRLPDIYTENDLIYFLQTTD